MVRDNSEGIGLGKIVWIIFYIVLLPSCKKPVTPPGGPPGGSNCPNFTASSVASQNTINQYGYIQSSTLAAGALAAPIAAVTPFVSGQVALLIQMQTTTPPAANSVSAAASNYEFVTIQSVQALPLSSLTGLPPGATPYLISFTHAIKNTYYSNAANVAGASKVTQLVNIPCYTNFTVPAGTTVAGSLWNGFTGGVLSFVVQGVLDVAGTISMSSSGFRGGVPVTTGVTTVAQAGESWNGPAGSGGGQVSSTNPCPGGGALNGYPWNMALIPGGVYNGASTICGTHGTNYGPHDLSQLYLGSGGGSGDNSSHGSSTNFVSMLSGKPGGGLILIYSNIFHFESTGIIQSNGGSNDTTSPQAGAGAGGTIYLVTNNINESLGTVSVNAGTSIYPAGPQDSNHWYGGFGTYGFYRIDVAPSHPFPTPYPSPTPYPGTWSGAGVPTQVPSNFSLIR